MFVEVKRIPRRPLILISVVRMEELEQIKKDYEKALEEGVNNGEGEFHVERLSSRLNT